VAAFFSPAFLALLGPAAVLTAPPGPPGPNAVAGGFVFAAAGDYSFGSNLQPSLDRLVGSNVDFLVGLGDLSYGSTSEQNFCQTVKAAMPNFTIVTGNHDSGESGGGNINNYVQYCPYTLPGPMTGTYGKEYWFDYPSPGPLARFILISPGVDMNVDGTGTWDYSVGTARYNFVRDTIDGARTAGIPWVFVGMHKNCITTGDKTCSIGTDIFDLLMAKKVDLILQGHDHNVQRSKQLDCAAITINGFDKSRFTIQVVVGATEEWKLEQILDAADEAGFHVLLLGYKTTGRGASVIPHQYDWTEVGLIQQESPPRRHRAEIETQYLR